MIARVLLGAALFVVIGCGHSGEVHPVASWNSTMESELSHSYLDKTLVLGHTFNVGPRIGDFSAHLADPRPFDAFAVTDADGLQKSLADGGKRLMIGTPVVIEGFLPPTTSFWPGQASAENDPSDGQVRVLFKVNSGETKGRFVAVLPVAAQNPIALRDAMNQRFQSKSWVDTWFASRTPEIQTALREKQVLAGMSNAEVRVAVGVASNESERALAGPSFVASYGDLQVVFAGATVAETKSMRAEAERIRAEEAAKKLAEEQRIAELEAADKKAAAEARAKAEAEADAKVAPEEKKATPIPADDLSDIPVVKAKESKESTE